MLLSQPEEYKDAIDAIKKDISYMPIELSKRLEDENIFLWMIYPGLKLFYLIFAFFAINLLRQSIDFLSFNLLQGTNWIFILKLNLMIYLVVSISRGFSFLLGLSGKEIHLFWLTVDIELRGKQFSKLMTDKEKIISMLKEFASPTKMASFFVNNATSDFLFIRPSGNPINAEGFEKMISSDVIQEKAEITKIHRLESLSDNVMMCVFTLGSKFTYKGMPNDDLPTVTSVFKKVDNVWKIYWMQRSTGNSDLSLWD